MTISCKFTAQYQAAVLVAYSRIEILDDEFDPKTGMQRFFLI
jgi:hypothetical protein